MKKLLLFLTLLFMSVSLSAADGMNTWRSHLAYGSVTRVVDGGEVVYALSGYSLFAVDKASGEMTCYSKQDGFHGANIIHISYDQIHRVLFILYEDGLMDMVHDGQISALPDLQFKQMNASKRANALRIYKGLAYLSMPFGIVVVNCDRREIADTYFIGDGGSEVDVKGVTIDTDSIYAVSSNRLYSASRKSNLLDYNAWHSTAPLPSDSVYQDIIVFDHTLLIIANNRLFRRSESGWEALSQDALFSRFCPLQNQLYIICQSGLAEWSEKKGLNSYRTTYPVEDIITDGNSIWYAAQNNGLIEQVGDELQVYLPQGPAVNIPYRMKVVNQTLYVVPGARWASQEFRQGFVMMYDIVNDNWTNIYGWDIENITKTRALDFMNVAVDPFDAQHFFVTSYGTGVYEFEGTQLVKHYIHSNSPLTTAVEKDALFYIRTDGAMFDPEGNLWLLNMGDMPVHVASPAQIAAAKKQEVADWSAYRVYDNDGTILTVHTAGEPFIDNRHENWKWIPYVRYQPGLILYDDNGTPLYGGDDRTYFRSSFTDQDGKNVSFTAIYAIVQDREGTIWVSMEKGLFIIPSGTDFRVSDKCERIKIPRNDGTNLADYLLDTERIQAICIDGANRKWIGTESSGVYLLSEDGLETIAHFTTDNSPLPSDRILSIAIDPASGRVFVGTDAGLMSYQSDAAAPEESFSADRLYAYPNPVRPDYQGVITIKGLMEDTDVKIMDNAGQLVCHTRSNGGLAIWDGKNGKGQRVSSGVYTAFCNTRDGEHHAVVKILVIN